MNLKTTITALACIALSGASMTTRAYTADTIPSYIDLQANVITLPDNAPLARWQAVAGRLDKLASNTGDDVVKILHIGDSHIQAEMVTTALRCELQDAYGNAGRGLVIPFRMAATNQPTDYHFTVTHGADSVTRLLKRPWDTTPGFTGIASRTDTANTVTVANHLPGHNISTARFYTDRRTADITYNNPADSASFTLEPRESLAGVYTLNGQPGIVYSAIGNNGACYSDYLLLDGFAQKCATLDPDIIILSMGTNEGFSSMTDDEIVTTTQQLIDSLAQANPRAVMLMWLPMECQRNRNHGQKPLSPYYDVNKRVLQIIPLLRDTAQRNGIAYWDFFKVSGANGASDKWLSDALMNKDRIHLYNAGYKLQGHLAAQALQNFFKTIIQP